MKLYPYIVETLDHYFSKYGLTYLSGQRDLLAGAAEAVLQAVPGTVTAIPFQPGMGKSTLIRAMLAVLSHEFQHATPIAQKIGGVIVVVEKTAEAEELESLCNGSRGRVVAKAISSPNDYNLAQGRCLNGSALSYQDCLGRSCPDYANCSLIQSTHQIHDTPILIMLHARYQRYMEDMSQFLSWEDSDGQHDRTLLLVDELPSFIEDNALDLSVINGIETDFSRFKPSYQMQCRTEKSALLANWNKTIRSPFFRLITPLQRRSGMFGIISRTEFESAGFTAEALEKVKKAISEYIGAPDHASIHLVNAVLSARNAYFAVGQDVSIFFPRLRAIHGEKQPATFLFSGTASLSPELSRNPNITAFPDRNLESFQHLQINIQRGDLFNSSRSGLEKKRNLSALVAWLQFMLPQVSQHHSKILVVTYKCYAQELWNALRDFHSILIPYIGNDGQAQQTLPYYGGLSGSNLYRESTCVICVGLNRFEPKDYISRALALDFDGHYQDEINTLLEVQPEKFKLDAVPCIMEIQDITLARDIVQLVFRSALRNHGQTQPIDLWLLQPPNGVIRYLQDYFGDCHVQEYTELPESCRTAVIIGREYQGSPTHAGKLLEFLVKWDGNESLTPADIRAATQLSINQFKEAKKHKEVQEYFKNHILTIGSGRNTRYQKILV